MKPIYFLLLVSIFFSCSNEKSTDQNNSKIQPAKSIPAEEFKPIELEVYIDDFKMRSGPGVEHEEVARLGKGDWVYYEGEKSMHSTEIKLRGVKLNAPWLKVKREDGLKGWIYASGVKSASPEKRDKTKIIDEIQMQSFFDKKIIDRINTYQQQWQLSNSSTDFAKTYLLGEKTQNEINEKLGDNIEIDDPSKLIDMSWLENSFQGFQNSLVAEGTMFNIFKDFRIMYAKVKETQGTEDDDFITFQFHVNELDSVEYYYKSWFMQTWDYGGHSLLGQGKHFDLLNEANDLLAKSKLFEKPILQTKIEILNDIAAEHITYWESKGKILEEMKKIISADFIFLTAEDKILLKTRYEQFKNPKANKIEVNNRAF
ncbi:MAG: hypothetical protein AB8F94_04550 [Saprospiraceae bacterium]